MRKAFMASICVNGINGGGLYLDDEGVKWLAQKLTLPEYYRNLNIPYGEISAVKKSRTLLLFPSITVEYGDGSDVKFVVFSRNKFIRIIEETSEIRVQ